MKIVIEKSLYQGIDLFTLNQLILQVEKRGIYRFYMYESSDRKHFSINFDCQIEEEKSQ